MTHSATLAKQQLQRLLQAGLATHVVDVTAVDMSMDTALAELRAAGGDCITTLADGRIAFSALHPLPELLADAAISILESHAIETGPAPEILFYSRRKVDPAILAAEQGTTCVVQTNRGQVALDRLAYRIHVMERILAQRPVPDPAISDTLSTLVGRVDDMQAQIADLANQPLPDPATDLAPFIDRFDMALERPAPVLDMSPLQASIAQQTAATSRVLERLEATCETLHQSAAHMQTPDMRTELTTAIQELLLPATARSEELISRLGGMEASLVELQHAVRSASVVAPITELYHEGITRLGTALQALSARVETVAAAIASATDTAELSNQMSNILARVDMAGTKSEAEVADLMARMGKLCAGLADVTSAIGTLRAETMQERERLADFNTVLDRMTARIDTVAAGGQTLPHDLPEFLDDLRFITAELVASSLKDQANAS